MLLIFDLDGTLIDSSRDLAISVNAMLSHFGRPALAESVVHSYVGNGAGTLVKRSLGPEASEDLVAEGLVYFLRFYRAHALEHTKLYPGVREALDRLRSESHSMAVLTNKPVKISFDILKALGLGAHFFQVYGGDSFSEKKPDPVGIAALRAESGAAAMETWMIGDSAVDVQTARNAGVRSCGVLWGFQPESFELWPPDVEVRDPQELMDACQPAVERFND